MVDRTKEGCGDVSDNGVDDALQAFVLIRKIEREMDTNVSAGHGRFNCKFSTNFILLSIMFQFQ